MGVAPAVASHDMWRPQYCSPQAAPMILAEAQAPFFPVCFPSLVFLALFSVKQPIHFRKKFFFKFKSFRAGFCCLHPRT